MTEFVKKLIEKLEERKNKTQSDMNLLLDGEYLLPCSMNQIDMEEYRCSTFEEVIGIVNELAEEYQPNQAHQFAILHADILARLGIDISVVWETGTQQAEALEQAYLRGRQDEKEDSNSGWILCSERLPEVNQVVLVTYEDRYIGGCFGVCTGQYIHSLGEWDIDDYMSADDFKCIVWRELPAPYQPKGE